MNLNEIDIKNMAVKPAKISNSANTIKVPEQINIPIGQKSASKVDIRAKYNLTQEQYNSLCVKYPNLSQLDDIQISNIIQKEFSSVVSKPVELGAKTDIKSVENKTTESETLPKVFNHKDFSELSNDKQLEIYSSELAKNNFLYGGEHKKTAQDWDNLSQNEKKSLIDAAAKNAKKIDSKILASNMTNLQTANHLKQSLSEFNQSPLDYQIESIHDYVFSIKDDCKTIGQVEYLQRQNDLSSEIAKRLKAQGEDIGTPIMNPVEIHQYCKDNKTNEHELEMEYFQDLKAQGKTLSEDQNKRFEELKEFDATIKLAEQMKAKGQQNDYGILSAFENSEYYSADFNTLTLQERVSRLKEYVNVACEGLPKDEQIKFKARVIAELEEKNTELGSNVHKQIVTNASDEEQLQYAKNKDLRAYNAVNYNIYRDGGKAVAATFVEELKDDKAVGEALICASLNYADKDHLAASSEIYSKSKNRAVENKYTEVMYDSKRVDVQAQDVMLKNAAKDFTKEGAINAAIKADKAYGENEVKATEYFSAHKECNDAMIEDGTFSRFEKENQTEAFKIHKARCEQNDYSKDEAVNYLNKLSDHIQNCDKDNQLDMHNEIMTSKYSEVQEHAAGNIKNYDPSVQPDAMSSVYKSGNQKAIETAVSNVSEFKSPDVQQVVMKQAVMELANLNNDSNVKFANGSLTNQDISKLSASERREYYLRLFDNASPADKIKYLKEIKDGKAKEIVYKLIGKFYPTLFKSMIQDDVTTAEKMFNMNLGGLNSVVESCIISKAETNPSFKFLRDRLKLNEEYPQTAKTVEYASIPNGFNNEKFNIYNKDKHGNLMA